MTNYIIIILVIHATFLTMYGNSNGYRSEEVPKRKILEQRKGAVIDTFYYANYATQAIQTNYDAGLELEDYYEGIIALEFRTNPITWEIYKYDFTDIFSGIVHEIRLSEGLTKELGNEPLVESDQSIMEKFNDRLKELTIEDIADYIDTNSMMVSTNSKPELSAVISNPYDHSLYVTYDGKYQFIDSKRAFNFTVVYEKEISYPKNGHLGFIGNDTVSQIIHISDTAVNNSRYGVPEYPLCGIWYIDFKNQKKFFSQNSTFLYDLKSDEKIKEYYNRGKAFVAIIQNDSGGEYATLFTESGRKELPFTMPIVVHDNQFTRTGDPGYGYERGEYVSFTDAKGVHILNSDNGSIQSVPKGYIPVTIEEASSQIKNVDFHLSDYIGQYPILKKGKTQYFYYNGSAYVEINKKSLKKLGNE